MNFVFLYLLILFLSCIFEGFILQIPLVLVVLIFGTIFIKKEWIFFAAILAGLILDSFVFTRLGLHSLFFLLILAGIFLYQKKFEIQSLSFILIFIGLGSAFYGLLFTSANLFFEIIFSLIFALVLFFPFSFFNRKFPPTLNTL